MVGAETAFIVAIFGTGTAATVAAIVINLVISAIIGKILAPDLPPGGRDVKGLQTVIKSNVAPRRVAYGESVTGGPYMMLETTGSTNEYLNFIIALTGHPIEDVLGIFLDDEYIDISGPGGATNTSDNGLDSNYYVNSGKFNSVIHDVSIRVIKNLGFGWADKTYVNDETTFQPALDDQARATLIDSHITTTWNQPSPASRDSGTGLYGTGFKLTNCAHIMVSIKFNRDVWSGFPQVKFHIKGKRLYNPALDPSLAEYGADSAGTHSLTDPDTWEYSDNLALGCLDYLLNTSYGLAARTSGILTEVRWDKFIEAINDSADMVVSGYTGGTTVPRYTLNGIFEVSGTPISNMEALLASGGAEMPYSQGQYGLRVAVYKPPNSENDIITEKMIVSPLSIRTHTPRSEVFNKVAGVYVEKEDADGVPIFEPTDFPIVDPLDGNGFNPYELVDGEEIIREVDYPFCVHEFEAQRLARIQLERIRQGLVIQFEADLEVLEYSVGNNIYLEILSDSKYANEYFFNRLGLDDEVQPRPDTPFTAYYKQFKIVDMSYTESFTIAVTLIEESEEVYEWNEGDANLTDYALQSELVIRDPTGEVLKPSFIVDSPYETITEESSAEAGTTVTTLIRWQAPTGGTASLDRSSISSYRLEYGIVDDPGNPDYASRVSTWIHAGTILSNHDSLVQGPVALETLYKVAGTVYDIRVQSVTYNGRSSGWAYYNEDTGDDYQPGAPPSVAGLTVYYIKPTNGTALHNGTGTLTLEARRIQNGVDQLLSSGSIQLFDESNNALTVGNGYQSPSDGYTGVLDSTNITGDITITLKNGVGGEALDTITLVDIADGGRAVYGYIEPSNGLAWTRATNEGAWTPATLTTDLDCTFVQNGEEVARIARRVTLTEASGVLAVSTVDHKNTNLNTERVNVTLSGDVSTAVTVIFEYIETPENTIVAETVSSAQGGNDGAPAEFYYIKPTNGTAIHNGTGTLTVEARKVTGATDVLLSNGTIRLYDPGNNIVEVANGYAAGSDGYTGVLDSGDINGDIILTLKDGTGGTPLDTITLVDIADGGSAVYGYIEPSDNGLVWTQAPNGGAWTPAPTTTDLDVTFVQGGFVVARWAYRITRDGNGDLTAATTDHTIGNMNTARITPSVVSGSGTNSITVKFDYSFGGYTGSVAESVKSVKGGSEGPQGPAGGEGADSFAVNYTNNAHAVPVTNTGTETWTGSGGSFFAFEGGTVLTLSTNTQGTGYPASNNQFRLNITPVSGDTLTEPTITGATTTTATLGNWAGNLTTATVYRITAYIRNSSGGTLTLSTDVTLTPSNQGADGSTGSQGVPGEDALAVNYTNNAHSVPVTNTGTETWTASGGDIFVFEGGTKLTLDTNTQGAAYPGTNSRFRLNIIPVSGNTLTEPTITGSGTTTGTLGNWAGNLTTVTVYQIDIYIRDSNANNVLLTTYATLTPSNQGANGGAGDNAISGFLTNEAHVVSTASDGTGASYTGAGGTFKVFNGTTDVTTSATFSVVGGSGSPSTKTQNGLTMSINTSTGVYSLSGTWTTDLENFTLRAVYGGVTIDRIYSISKSKAGTDGSAATGVVRLPVFINSVEVLALGNGNARADIQFLRDGSLVVTGETGLRWFTSDSDSTIGDDYQVRCASVGTGQSWDVQAAVVGTWTSDISATRTWSMIRVEIMEGAGSDIVQAVFEIRKVGATSIEEEADSQAEATLT